MTKLFLYFPGFYRSQLTQRILVNLEVNDGTASQAAKKVSILDSIHMLAQAWANVKSSTISNCFKKAFKVQGEGELHIDALSDVLVPSNMNRESFEAILEEEMEIGQMLEEELDLSMEDVEDGEEEAENVEEDPKVTPKECLEALAKVRSFCQVRNFSQTLYDGLKGIENECVKEMSLGKVQRSITSYFK